MGNKLLTRLKLLLRDKAVVFCYCISVVVGLCVFLGLDSVAEERSSVPIGLVKEDESAAADKLADAIKDKNTFYVYEKPLKELEDMLVDGYINSIFIIKEGYGERIEAGEYEKLIKVISAEDDKVAVVLSDIIAGNMVYEIAVNRAFNRYNRLKDVQKNRAEFIEYVDAFAERPEYSLPIQFEYVGTENGYIKEEAVTNGMIYKQMIAGMICMLIGIVAFTACNGLCLEYENGIQTRRNSLPGSGWFASFADFLGILIFTSPLAIAAGFVMAGISGIFITWFYFLVILFTCYILARLVKHLSAYQVVGIIIVVGLGVAGFISAFSGLVGGMEFLKYTPNGLYIDWFISL